MVEMALPVAAVVGVAFSRTQAMPPYPQEQSHLLSWVRVVWGAMESIRNPMVSLRLWVVPQLVAVGTEQIETEAPAVVLPVPRNLWSGAREAAAPTQGQVEPGRLREDPPRTISGTVAVVAVLLQMVETPGTSGIPAAAVVTEVLVNQVQSPAPHPHSSTGLAEAVAPGAVAAAPEVPVVTVLEMAPRAALAQRHCRPAVAAGEVVVLG